MVNAFVHLESWGVTRPELVFFFFCKYCSLLFFLVYAGVLGLGVPRREGLQPGGVSFLVIAKWQLNR